ncbi:predicted protein [Naegleria gruberi]|uniref:Predicted protein n=1 Tax=Naegleria gruberi TaxID=5762 RepID=D2V661_NAEGR|nr:uncharacterized protein NAEGRDRAFT_31446 [Naegleria gruberi]EFC47910.1 predicted protein [Naegleria gruberi]|eukprot:XP_002680654.1 predicted protein [Naegleria gruberi strain NEG-M]
MGVFFPPPFSRSYQDLQNESLVSQLVIIPIFILCDDIFTFIVHFLLHKIPYVYKYVHYLHHEIKYSVSIGSQYFHPIEFLVTVPAVMSGPLLTHAHLFWSFVWTVVKTFEAIHSHSGFDFMKYYRTSPVTKSILLDASEHTYHHTHYQDCYGAWYCLIDKLIGTNLNFVKFTEKKQYSKDK